MLSVYKELCKRFTECLDKVVKIKEMSYFSNNINKVRPKNAKFLQLVHTNKYLLNSRKHSFM